MFGINLETICSLKNVQFRFKATSEKAFNFFYLYKKVYKV